MKKLALFLFFIVTFSSINLFAKIDSPIVCIETTQGVIEIKLHPEIAPKTCENFLGLIHNNYYNDVTFHRVIKNFMIQTGDPTGTGAGGKSFWGKPFEDEVKKDIKFDKKGLVAMANAGPNTNGSQFFITTVLTPWLNMHHTIFGEVISGYDVVEKIEKSPTDSNGRPFNTQKILKVYIKE
jgi:peptidylprolyl isomerase